MKEEQIALYIHVPFCRQKCLYCDFPSYKGKDEYMIEYAEAVSKEIGLIGTKKIKTIFIGGGTPTYLPLKALNIIKESIDKLNKSRELEFTVEGNPDSLTREKIKFLRAMGVNRLSIGLQAWQDKLLKKLGRIHTIEQFKECYKVAREEGFKNINIDLMFGLPEQAMENWNETIENVTLLNPEHISCYGLIIEEGTPFYKMYEIGDIKLPDEELEREMYQKTINFLKEHGYHQYEISNFSKDNMQCRHNLVYWNLEQYIGCGPAASSYVYETRYKNEEDIETYIRKINENNSAVAEKYKNSIKDDMEEFMFMGLRKIEGISEEEFYDRFQESIDSVYKNIVDKYTDSGLLIRESGRIRLSARGIEISNQVMCDFIL